jgi:peroxiredoxin
MMKKFVLMVILAALFGAAAAACVAAQEEEPTPAPDFSVTDLKGNPLTLASYKGKVLVLNFWATWCPPCREEIPDFIEAYKNLRSQGLEILGLSVDRIPAERLREWTERAGMNYPVAMATRPIIAGYEPGDYIPATIIIDRNGLIRYRSSGLMDKDTLVRLFREYSK